MTRLILNLIQFYSNPNQDFPQGFSSVPASLYQTAARFFPLSGSCGVPLLSVPFVRTFIHQRRIFSGVILLMQIIRILSSVILIGHMTMPLYSGRASVRKHFLIFVNHVVKSRKIETKCCIHTLCVSSQPI